jgi:ornithine decarboxylase
MMTKARFILSRKKALESYDELSKLSDIVSYSYKTNPDVGKLLEKETSCLFSVHSLEDGNSLKDAGRIIYFAQAWDDDELAILFKKGIRRFVVDNDADLEELLGFNKKHKEDIILFLRMKLKENTVQTGKHFVYGFSSSKVNSVIKSLSAEKNFTLGIHFHRKTQNVSEWNLLEELQETIDKEIWSSIRYVNIGGGLPAEYKNFPKSVLKGIFSQIKSLRAWLNARKIEMIIEPGRYIAANSVCLEASIKSIYDRNIIIDCSVYNAAMDTFVANIRLMVKGELEEGSEGEAYTIKGCTPDSMDIFRYKVFIKKPKVGDKIVFLNAGAYTYSTDFCSLPKLQTVIVD